MDEPGGSKTVAGLVAFAELLRELGLEVSTPRVERALRALGSADADDRETAYWVLRATLTSSAEDVRPFDEAFALLWEGGLSTLQLPTPGHRDGATSTGASTGSEAADVALAADVEAPSGDTPAGAGRRWSAVEQLRDLDFRAYGPDELVRAARLIAELARVLPMRRSRRLEPAPAGRRLDHRATLRRAIPTEGHPLQLAWRRPSSRPRRIVFAVDVSGSMEPYARPVMIFLQAARRASRGIEAFAFGTRLTRLTRKLGGRDPDEALERVARAVPDWAGGTRIGDNLKLLNDVWGRRGVTRGAVVVIVSDGWERGDVELLGREMERLHRRSHRLIWVNPLGGDPRYEPLAAGMAIAMPWVDLFLAGHNLRALEDLAHALSEASLRGIRRGSCTRASAPSAGKPAGNGVQPASGP